MNYRVTSKALVNMGVAACLVAASEGVKAADGPSLKHGPPGSVTYDSISSIPEKMRHTITNSETPDDPYAEPLLDQDVRRFISYRERIRDSSSTVGKLKIKLASIQEGELASYQYMGLIPNGPKREGPWTSVIRVYSRPDGTPIFLYEHDFAADGGSVVVYRELLNEKVGETPARLVVKRSADGRAVSELIWVTPLRDMKLSTWGDVLNARPGSPYDKQWLNGIAEALTIP